MGSDGSESRKIQTSDFRGWMVGNLPKGVDLRRKVLISSLDVLIWSGVLWSIQMEKE